MIEVQNLTKAFGDKTVLDNISVKFETGKTNLIIGQSGSGKTVLMKNLVGLLEPTSGKVLYDGRDFVQMSKKEKVMMRREMGMIFQSAALFDSLNVPENVMFPLDMFSNMNYRERVKRAQECLDRVNLIDAQQKYPGEISGGMQKRVAIARAIVMNPKYLFCDEPNSGLDPKTSLVIDELLSGITKDYNMTTIINTHDMNSVMGIGENICFICKGHKEWQGNKDQVMSSTNEQLNDLVFASDLFRKVKEVEMKEKKDRVDDALRATRAAIEEGTVPGGGVAYIRAIDALEGMKGDNEDETTGIEIVKRAIEEPLRQIVANAGKEGAVIVQKVKEGKGDFGYNARKDCFENLCEAGVIDPAKVTRVALENAASIAGMFLTTECVIAEKKEEAPAAPAMNPGMGGMGGMM